jgi:hypothetical protein
MGQSDQNGGRDLAMAEVLTRGLLPLWTGRSRRDSEANRFRYHLAVVQHNAGLGLLRATERISREVTTALG